MKIKGKHIIDAAPSVVWKMVLDPRVLEKITPGIKTLEEKETDVYTAISEVKVGPVRGAFEGDLAIKDKVTEESCVVALDQKSKMGNAKAEISMNLIPTEDGKNRNTLYRRCSHVWYVSTYGTANYWRSSQYIIQAVFYCFRRRN